MVWHQTPRNQTRDLYFGMVSNMSPLRAKQRAIEKALEKEMEEVMESQNSEELNGDENVNEILQRFTIVDKGRLNYLHKIFKDYQAEEEHPYLSHQV